ncbi:hypothetical protein EDB19DRAFT_1911151 [Suillus lakei]|nr:hypothetical protein EDB19DRAFT_1911151 [Suillus lakei]
MESAPDTSTIVRNLTFQSDDLGKNTTILLVFDAPIKSIYEVVYPVVWKVSTFRKTGIYSLKVSYTNDLAFAHAQDEGASITDAATCIELKPGQQTTLTLEDDVFGFSKPVTGTPDSLTAENKTGFTQELEFGFFPEGSFLPDPALYFKEVGDGSNATTQWKPVLRVYITPEYKQAEVLDHAIDAPVVLDQDLHGLHKNTTWNLTWDAGTGHYKLTKVSRETDESVYP